MRIGAVYLLGMLAMGLAAVSCSTAEPGDDLDRTGYRPVPLKYATGFRLYENTTLPAEYLVEILKPGDSAAGPIYEYRLTTDESTTGIPIPVDAAALGSTTFVPYFKRLGEMDRVEGVGYAGRVMDSGFQRRLAAGEVVELVSAERVDIERVVSLGPSVYLANDFGDTDLNRLSDMGVSVMVLTEYLEPHPLGRAEWILLFGALTDRLDEAREIFGRIEEAYLDVRARVDTTVSGPRVFAGSRYGDFWYAPGGDSYLATFFRDAGGDYVFDDRRWSGNAQLDFEAALAAVADADYWGLILASDREFTMDQLRQMDPRYAALEAFEHRHVFVCNTAKVDYFGRAILEPDLVLSDLVRIFHADSSGGDYHYFHPVD